MDLLPGRWPNFPVAARALRDALASEPELAAPCPAVFYVCGAGQATACGLSHGLNPAKGMGVVVVPAAAALAPGAAVAAHGLRAAPELNGKEGRVVALDRVDRVGVDFGAQIGTKAVRREHLHPIGWDAPERLVYAAPPLPAGAAGATSAGVRAAAARGEAAAVAVATSAAAAALLLHPAPADEERFAADFAKLRVDAELLEA